MSSLLEAFLVVFLHSLPIPSKRAATFSGSILMRFLSCRTLVRETQHGLSQKLLLLPTTQLRKAVWEMKRRFAPWNARKPSRTCVEALMTRETGPDEKDNEYFRRSRESGRSWTCRWTTQSMARKTLENRKYLMYLKEGKNTQKKKKEEAIQTCTSPFFFFGKFTAQNLRGKRIFLILFLGKKSTKFIILKGKKNFSIRHI